MFSASTVIKSGGGTGVLMDSNKGFDNPLYSPIPHLITSRREGGKRRRGKGRALDRAPFTLSLATWDAMTRDTYPVRLTDVTLPMSWDRLLAHSDTTLITPRGILQLQQNPSIPTSLNTLVVLARAVTQWPMKLPPPSFNSTWMPPPEGVGGSPVTITPT